MKFAETNSGLLLALGGALAVLGLVVIALALFSDRSRGRQRCPRCWYDMSGAPSLTCPECGKGVRKERRLLRTRRRWRLAASGALLATFGVASAAAPVLNNDRWIAYAPTWVLVKFYPPAGKEYVNLSVYPPVLHPVIEELKARVDRPSFSPREWRAVLEHCRVFQIKRQPIPPDGKILGYDSGGIVKFTVQQEIGKQVLFVDMHVPYELIGLAEIHAMPRVPEARQLIAGSLYAETCGVGADIRTQMERHQLIGVVDNHAKTMTFDVVLRLAPDNFWRHRTANDTEGRVYEGPVTIAIPSGF